MKRSSWMTMASSLSIQLSPSSLGDSKMDNTCAKVVQLDLASKDGNVKDKTIVNTWNLIFNGLLFQAALPYFWNKGFLRVSRIPEGKVLLGFDFPGTERDNFQKNVGQLNLHDFNLNKITCVAFLFLVEGCPVGTSRTTRLVPLTLSSSGFCLLKRPIKESYKASCHSLGFLHLAFIWEHKSKGVCIGRRYRHISTWL